MSDLGPGVMPPTSPGFTGSPPPTGDVQTSSLSVPGQLDFGTPPNGAPDSAAAPATSTPAKAARVASPDFALLAPHALRLLAFLIDAGVVTVATLSLALVVDSMLALAVLFLATFVLYHTLAVWLSRGRTFGKAACNLSVRHINQSDPRGDLSGLAWAFGRASLGYLVVDLFGIGVLVALGNAHRRCLHDYVFGSEVVCHPTADDPAHPRGRRGRVYGRLAALKKDMEAAVKAKQERGESLAWLWKWVTAIPTKLIGIILASKEIWQRLVQHLAGTAQSAASAPAAQVLPAGKIVAVVATTGMATAGAGVAAATTYLSAPILGDWGNPAAIRVTRVGVDSYRAVQLADFLSPRPGCTFSAGTEVMQMNGRGDHYIGKWLWVSGSNGQNCRFKWEPATFDLIDSVTLRECTTDPALATEPDACVTVSRNLAPA
jgi:uncharacterized RDD family membrane protein YckC